MIPALLASILVILPSAPVAVRATSGLPPAMQQAVGQAQDTAQPLWDEVPWQTQQEILALVQQRLHDLDAAVAHELANRTGLPLPSLLDAVPLVHDQVATAANSALGTATQTAQEVEEALLAIVGEVLGSALPVPVAEPGPPPSVSFATAGTCDVWDLEVPRPALLGSGELACFALTVVAATVAQVAFRHAVFGLDLDGDGMDDGYAQKWGRHVDEALRLLLDWDGDGLENLQEFRWGLVPLCLPARVDNCMDFERHPATGEGGDHWLDGAEVRYWNNPANDPLLGVSVDVGDVPLQAPADAPARDVAPSTGNEGENRGAGTGGGGAGGLGSGGSGGGGGGGCQSNCGGGPALPPAPDPNDPPSSPNLTRTIGLLLQDPDRLLDSDGDGNANANDTDSDNDGLLDGVEFHLLGTYPEHADSDCAATASACTASTLTWFYDPEREGSPGRGDGLNDSAELAAWATLGAAAWQTDYDADGIQNNLLDPDSEGDGLLDGHEVILGAGQVRPDRLDTEFDGVPDGAEVAWSQDTDLDGRVNANDPDSDNDGMPDKYEADHGFNMVDPADAVLDRDGDGLNNVGECLHGTDVDDMDTEDDLLLDGEEVNAHHTDPHFWDTDGDGMPDRFEALHGLDPLSPADGGADADGDAFDRDQDGIPEQAWPNLSEYRYGRGAGYSEAAQGPWLLGTNPRDTDTDKDRGGDGYEVFYASDPRLPADANLDQDQDGLNWTQEVRHGTDPGHPDTDGDGLCDGGRAPACHFPGLPSMGNQAGESDYGSVPYATDSDGDGIPDPAEAQLWDPGASGQAQDMDGDLLNGVVDADSDNDALEDGEEQDVRRTDLRLPDTDGDGLNDGAEVADHFTDPLVADTDGDTLRDGEEANAHRTDPLVQDTDEDMLRDDVELAGGTDPLTEDTDGDGLPDRWEVAMATNPRANDAGVDLDQDGLTNAQEHGLGTHPAQADSEGDGLPDGYEDTHGLEPVAADGGADLDGDGLANLQEHNATTLPGKADTDQDGLLDGWEVHAAATDPLALDSDNDGLDDGVEKAAWDLLGPTAWSVNHDGDAFGNSLMDLDSDGDGLSDRDELVASQTRPDEADTDGDTVSDFDEVVTYGGQYDPNETDTDGDGQDDAEEIALADANADDDQDGLKNGDEDNVYGTDRSVKDTDCDGIEDGPEATYWDGAWDVGGVNRLLVGDVDGDSLADGAEIGATGTPPQVFYRTDPVLADTDDDGLTDVQEAVNGYHVDCGSAAPAAASLPALPAGSFGSPVPVPVPAVGQGVSWVDQATRLRYGQDANGWYVQGGYGVKLYVPATGLLPVVPGMEDLLALVRVDGGGRDAPAAPGMNGKQTSASDPDTDKDGIKDGDEVNTYFTDPNNCDTDFDGLGDGLEVGVRGSTRKKADACTHRDSDVLTTTDPLNYDTDGDGLQDGKPVDSREKAGPWEDGDADGKVDLIWMARQYCGRKGSESDPADADTDDDGISDVNEVLGFGVPTLKTDPFCFDTDLDGLSDGLEQGVTSPVTGTVLRNINLGSITVPTWQPYQGFGDVTSVLSADTDGDGIVDGLEDVNHNGVFGDWEGIIGAQELNPHVADGDGDGLSDGLELRLWSRTFMEVVTRSRWVFSELRFDGSAGSSLFNPFETDPRSENTDGDVALDGDDINPRLNAVFQVAFQRSANDANAFMTREPSDCCWGDDQWKPDVQFFIQLDFLGGVSTTLWTQTVENVPAKTPTRVPPGAGSTFSTLESNPASGLSPTDPIGSIGGGQAPGFRFDLPDSVGDLTTAGTKQLTVTLVVQGWDVDEDVDDPLDFKAGRDSQSGQTDREIRTVFNLIEKTSAASSIRPGRPDPFLMDLQEFRKFAADDKVDDGDGDVKAELTLGLSDNAPRYFIENALLSTGLAALKPPTNMLPTCYGTPNCR